MIYTHTIDRYQGEAHSFGMGSPEGGNCRAPLPRADRHGVHLLTDVGQLRGYLPSDAAPYWPGSIALVGPGLFLIPSVARCPDRSGGRRLSHSPTRGWAASKFLPRFVTSGGSSQCLGVESGLPQPMAQTLHILERLSCRSVSYVSTHRTTGARKIGKAFQ